MWHILKANRVLRSSAYVAGKKVGYNLLVLKYGNEFHLISCNLLVEHGLQVCGVWSEVSRLQAEANTE